MVSADNQNPIEIIGAEYIKQVNSGQDSNLEEMIATHPEREAEIRDFVKALSFVEKCKSK